MVNNMHELEEIISKIEEQTKLTRDEIIQKIKEKRRELSNLISEQGAAYIIAKDFGIDLIKKRDYEIKISNLISGMKNIQTVGRITRIDSVKEFKTEKASGKLCSVYIGDDTGIIRIVLWNDEIDKLNGIEKGDVVRVSGYIRDNFGNPEIRISKNGAIEKIEDRNIPSVDDIENKFATKTHERVYNPSSIGELEQGANAKLRACIVQIFSTNPFFFTCPDCGVRVKDKCNVHNKREPNLVLSGVIDDGTGSIRVVLFRNSAEKLIGMSTDEAWKQLELSRNINDITKKIQLGKDFIFNGYVKRNTLFDRIEFIVNEIENVDNRKEIEKLIVE